MANKPFRYTGTTNSTTSYLLTPPASGITRIITKITVAHKISINPLNTITTTVTYGSSKNINKADMIKDSQNKNVYFENLYIVQNSTADVVFVKTTLALSGTETAYVVVEGIEIDNVDDTDITPLIIAESKTGGASYTLTNPTSNERYIIKQISLTNDEPFSAGFSIGTAESTGAYDVASYYRLGLGGNEIAFIDNANIVIDANDSLNFTVDPSGDVDFTIVAFGQKINL